MLGRVWSVPELLFRDRSSFLIKRDHPSARTTQTETIVTDHRVDGVPTLVLANKQDCEGAMAVEDIKQMFNNQIVGKLNVSEGNVLPISALRGCVFSLAFVEESCRRGERSDLSSEQGWDPRGGRLAVPADSSVSEQLSLRRESER